MSNASFSPEFRRFIRRYITSIEQIDVLLLLFGEPGRTWNAVEISATLRSSDASIRSRLESLAAAKLIVKEKDGYRYEANARGQTMVEQLREHYTVRRYSVIELVFSGSDPMQSLAEAFRVRQDGDNADG